MSCGSVEFGAAHEEKERDPGIVPAGMRWACARVGGADLDGLGGVRAAGEVEPVAEDGGVVTEPHERCGNYDDACEPEGGRAQLAAAEEHDAHGGPRKQGENPAIVAREDGGYEDEGDLPEQAG